MKQRLVRVISDRKPLRAYNGFALMGAQMQTHGPRGSISRPASAGARRQDARQAQTLRE
jgi:hypothetical protein